MNAAPTVNASFDWSDAWVLAAVALGGGENAAGLKEIVEAGDVINRSILTAEQLRGGLAKLMAAGHVARRDRGFAVVGDALLEARRASLRGPSSFDVLQRFEEFLDSHPYATQAGTVAADAPLEGVTDEDVARACEAYKEERKAQRREAGTRESD